LFEIVDYLCFLRSLAGPDKIDAVKEIGLHGEQ